MSEKAFSDAPSLRESPAQSLDLSRLIALVEAARAPDRELDAIVSWELGWRDDEHYTDGGATEYAFLLRHPDLPAKASIANRMCIPKLTASLDAALALVERVLPGWTVANIGQQDDKSWWAELREGYLTSYDRVALGGCGPGKARPKTPALALLLALLRALQAEA